jgi:tetratricopeptide (TPR) repeat protein
MPVFDFLYRFDELVADLDFFLAPDGPPRLKLTRPLRKEPTLQELENGCGTDESRWLYSGALLLQRGNGRGGETCLRRLHSMNPEKWSGNVNYLINLALALMLQGKHDEAIPLAAKSVEKSPQSIAIRKRYIQVLEKANRPAAEILEQVDFALALSPGDEELQEKKGNLENELGS